MSGTIQTDTMKLNGVTTDYNFPDPLGTVQTHTGMLLNGVQEDYYSGPAEGTIETGSMTFITMGTEDSITNGTFDTDTTGWSGSNMTLASVGGQLEATSTGGNPHAFQGFATDIGKTYKVSYDLIRGTTPGENQFRVGETSVGFPNHYLKSHPDSINGQTAVFTATTTTTYVVMGFGENANGQTSYWDNISVFEIGIENIDYNYPLTTGFGSSV